MLFLLIEQGQRLVNLGDGQRDTVRQLLAQSALRGEIKATIEALQQSAKPANAWSVRDSSPFQSSKTT